MPYNQWKIEHGFYMLIGPGKNESYIPGDSYTEFVKTNNKKTGGVIADIQADTDGEIITETGDNMLASGAVNKFYDSAVQHNRINLLQLQKKYVEFELNGANFAIMRGEKLPAMIVDNDKANQADDLSEENIVKNLIYENLSGWFIIDSIRWVFSVDQPATYGTNWRTYVRLIRREWPISGQSICPTASSEDQNAVTVVTDTSTGSSVESTETPTDPSTGTDTSTGIEEVGENETISLVTQVPVTGLLPHLQQAWEIIFTTIPGCSLVRARWYAQDKDGNEDLLFKTPHILTAAGQYKILDENKQPHVVYEEYIQRFYGNAINIKPSGMTCDELIQKIMETDEILNHFWSHGLLALKSNDGTEETVLVIGAYMSMLRPFWNLVRRVNPEYDQAGYISQAEFYNTIMPITRCTDEAGNPKDPSSELKGIDK